MGTVNQQLDSLIRLGLHFLRIMKEQAFDVFSYLNSIGFDV